MICKNCSAEYEDSFEKCPGCGAEKEATEEIAADAVNNTEAEETVQEEAESKVEEKADKEASAEEAGEKNENSDNGRSAAENKAATVKKQSAGAVVKKSTRTAVSNVKVVTKREKKLSAVIVALVCFVGVLAVGLSVINITTDKLTVSDDGQKMVAGVGFAPQEEKKLEELLAKCFSAAKKEYNSELADTEAFLARINPADKWNVYSAVNNTAETVKTEPDPAKRFADENGEYAYYRLDKKKVDRVLSVFGLESYRTENYKDYYYFDGYYYFAAGKAEQTPKVLCEIVKSRRVLDGSYYVEGYFYIEKAGEKIKSDNCYFIVEMNESENAGEDAFVIKKIGAEPIFAADGSLVAEVKSRKTEKDVVEGKTDDGKLYCRYILEHPLFDDENNGYANAKEFFRNSVSVYKLKAENSQESYDEFKKSGGDVGELPFVEIVTASVTFEDDERFSIVEKISSYSPENKKEASEEQEAEYTVRLCKKSVEAYTFDKETGDFVSKDSVLGKDYLTIRKLLYRICNSYSYEDVLPVEPADENENEDSDEYSGDGEAEEIPEDVNEQGAAIYESAWALTDEGVTFYYVTEMGFVQQVTVPYAVVEKLKAK